VFYIIIMLPRGGAERFYDYDSPGEAAGGCTHGGRRVPPGSVPDGDAAADHIREVRRLVDAQTVISWTTMTGILRTDGHDRYSHDVVFSHEMETLF
jgi:hypothetical protein